MDYYTISCFCFLVRLTISFLYICRNFFFRSDLVYASILIVEE